MHGTRRGSSGYLYIECLLTVAIVSALLAIGAAATDMSFLRTYRLEYAALGLVEDMRRVQQGGMYGYADAQGGMTSLVVSEEGYYYERRAKRIGDPISFPPGIKSVFRRRITFHGNGLPYADMTIKLEDEVTGARASIYVAVQTGRIRLEVTE